MDFDENEALLLAKKGLFEKIVVAIICQFQDICKEIVVNFLVFFWKEQRASFCR